MPSNYPGALDVLTNPLGTDQLSSPSHSGQHTNANDALEAIEAELGIDPAGASATVVARLNRIQRPGTMRVRRGANQSVAHADDTTIVYDTITSEEDEEGDFSIAVGTGIITINNAGWYAIKAGVVWASNATGLRRIQIWEGLNAIASDTRMGVTGTTTDQTVSTEFEFSAAATTRVVVHQTSTAAL